MNKTLKNFLYSVPFAVASMLPVSCEKSEQPKPKDNVAPVINVFSPVDKMTYGSNNIPLSCP